jgi:hypothetical protein
MMRWRRFGFNHFVLAGERGMITAARNYPIP